MSGRNVWFGMWYCHCATLTATADEVPACCPTHASGLIPGRGGSRELVLDVDPGIALGYRPVDQCACPRHDKEPRLFEVAAS